jgi:predicted DNA-binding protein (UPF0251 family)
VCTEPDNRLFTPEKSCGETVTLAIEDLEAVRLCDLEGLEQDEAAVRMNISRGTLQRTLYDARRKIADALCSGKSISIGGGNYEVIGTVPAESTVHAAASRIPMKKGRLTNENCRNNRK